MARISRCELTLSVEIAFLQYNVLAHDQAMSDCVWHFTAERDVAWSLLPFDQEMRQRLERGGSLPEAVQLRGRVGHQFVGAAERLIYAKQGRISGFFGGNVLARCLSKLFRSLGNVEHVIDDLEGQYDVLSK